MTTDNLGVGCPDPGRNRISLFNIILQTNENINNDNEDALDTGTQQLPTSPLTPAADTSRPVSPPGNPQSPQPPLESSITTVDNSSHILLPVNRMIEVINNNLGTYKICKIEKLQLIQQHSVHLADRLTIHCQRCYLNHRSMKTKGNCISQKLEKQKRLTNKDRKLLRRLYNKARNLKKLLIMKSNSISGRSMLSKTMVGKIIWKWNEVNYNIVKVVSE